MVGVLGQEPTLFLYIQHLVEVFRDLKRVLHPTGTFWLNLGDAHAQGGKHVEPKAIYDIPLDGKPVRPKQKGMHGKNLLMVPARVALALQQDGWLLRADIIWAKGVSWLPSFAGAVMPESCLDRPCHSHEHLFLFALQGSYYYDIDGCREAYATTSKNDALHPYRGRATKAYADAGAQNPSDAKRRMQRSINEGIGRNLRDVWVIPKQNYPGLHYATFPEKLVEPIVRLATSEKGCCPLCGTPIRRKTIREPVPAAVQAAFEAARVTSAATSGRTDGHTRSKPNYRRRVLRTEWEAGCECENMDVEAAVPCMVVDPFSGSGRAGVVAVRLGRRFTGIDASGDYCRDAERNIRAVLAANTGDASAARSGGTGIRSTVCANAPAMEPSASSSNHDNTK